MTWKVLEPLVQADPSPIRSAVRAVTEAWGRKARRLAIQDLANTLGERRTSFVLRLLDETTAPARRLALELIPGISGIDANLRRNSREALRDRQVPSAVRLQATKALLRGLDPAGKGAGLMLRAYIAGLGRKRILERLDEVAKEFGNPPAMEFVRAELRQLEKLRCPRCGSLRRRKNMADHLWNRHQMLLVGHRARTAIQALDERLTTEPPAAALVEFHRDLLGKGLHDSEALSHICNEAAERSESICPHCYAFVPVKDPPPLRAAETAPGRISAGGCAMVLSEVAGKAHWRIQKDSRVIMDADDPAASAIASSYRRLAVILGLLSIVLAATLSAPWHLAAAAGAIALGSIFLGLAYRESPTPHDPLARAVDLAWEKLIPELSPGDAIARFALASVGRGTTTARVPELAKAIDDAEEATTLGAVSASVLAPLWWLQFNDQREDPVPITLTRFRRCFGGELPLSAAAGWCGLWLKDRPARGERARFRALLCQTAFESGLGVWDIVELGRAFPPLGTAFGSDDVDGLSRLCYLWDQRQIRPWHSLGPTATLFELARNAELSVQVLETASDLLLFHRLPAIGNEQPETLLLCGRGLVYRDAVLREPPGDVRIRPCEEWRGGGYEVRFGPHRLRFVESPDAIVQRLKAWANFFLREFLPKTDSVLKYRASDQLGMLLDPVAARCPACSKSVIAIAGQVGAIPASQK